MEWSIFIWYHIYHKHNLSSIILWCIIYTRCFFETVRTITPSLSPPLLSSLLYRDFRCFFYHNFPGEGRDRGRNLSPHNRFLWHLFFVFAKWPAFSYSELDQQAFHRLFKAITSFQFTLIVAQFMPFAVTHTHIHRLVYLPGFIHSLALIPLFIMSVCTICHALYWSRGNKNTHKVHIVKLILINPWVVARLVSNLQFDCIYDKISYHYGLWNSQTTVLEDWVYAIHRLLEIQVICFLPNHNKKINLFFSANV